MSPPLHRRDFVRGILATTSGACLIGSAVADEPKDVAPDINPEVNARMDLILSRYGANLDDAARVAIRLDMESIVRRADALREFELTNGDEPFPIFVPFRAPLA